MTGIRKDYPVYIVKDRKKVQVDNDDDLINIIGETYLQLKELTDKAELKQALNKLGIWEGEETEPMQIIDGRTSDILSAYQFFKYSPEKAFDPIPQIWFESYNILSKLEPRMF